MQKPIKEPAPTTAPSTDVQFWIKMFAPRTQKWMKETRQRLKASTSIFETKESNQAKIAALNSLLG